MPRLILKDIAIVAVMAMTVGLNAQSPVAEELYSGAFSEDFSTNVYWGDTHVHTSLSSNDANLIGGNRAPATIAYRFARGETVESSNGMRARLRRPLDFLVVADHAEGLGVLAGIQTEDEVLLNSPVGKDLIEKYRAYQADQSAVNTEAFFGAYRAAPAQLPSTHLQSVWETVVSNADAYYEPGVFTTFAGYEWSSPGSMTGGNLHRVVIFKDTTTATQVVPYSAYDSRNPEDLWAFLEGYERQTGGEVMAIPHNANLSHGKMFAQETYDGSPLTSSWAKIRSRWEPLYEVTQTKGDSETHPILSSTDEFADFETWSSWGGATMSPKNHIWAQNWNIDEQPEVKKAEYARSALKRGLDQQAKLGVNPFKFGMIGSTDSHTSLSMADNYNYWGQYPNTITSRTRLLDKFSVSFSSPLHWETAAAGYAALWAKENTREALFAAMRRKEVYASTGPRITVRFFGGWSFEAQDASRPDLARIGYAKGVPMGGDLTSGPDGIAPSFLIRAVRDPDGANLDRVQVVKGWRDVDGELHERVFNVALSDGRAENGSGVVEPVGNTVDVADASYTNSIGDPELAIVWTDLEFDTDELAFYYVRVLEIPTPRWTAYDAKFLDLRDLPDDITMVTQERAYTSPIWYTPN